LAVEKLAEPLRFGDLEVRVVTTEDLIAMKKRAAADPGRRRSKALRDQADAARERSVPCFLENVRALSLGRTA
jgi:hypothetical protein